MLSNRIGIDALEQHLTDLIVSPAFMACDTDALVQLFEEVSVPGCCCHPVFRFLPRPLTYDVLQAPPSSFALETPIFWREFIALVKSRKGSRSVCRMLWIR